MTFGSALTALTLATYVTAVVWKGREVSMEMNETLSKPVSYPFEVVRGGSAGKVKYVAGPLDIDVGDMVEAEWSGRIEEIGNIWKYITPIGEFVFSDEMASALDLAKTYDFYDLDEFFEVPDVDEGVSLEYDIADVLFEEMLELLLY